MKLDPTGEIIFNSCSSGAPGSLLPCIQACLLPAVTSAVTLTQHDFAFAVPLGALSELAVLFLAAHIHQSIFLTQSNQCGVLLGTQIH